MRPETGLMKFGDDWTGVFIRGDNAYAYALALRQLIEGRDHGIYRAQLKGLANLLGASFEGGHTSETVIQSARLEESQVGGEGAA